MRETQIININGERGDMSIDSTGIKKNVKGILWTVFCQYIFLKHTDKMNKLLEKHTFPNDHDETEKYE